MNARTSRSAKAGTTSTDDRSEQAGLEPDIMFDDLLDARFDDEGRLAQVGKGGRQRTAERLDPRPPSTSAEQLERAVRKLAEGLDAIEKQSRPSAKLRSEAMPEARVARAETGEPGKRDFVTYGLDRLEARLEALSARLQSRATSSGGRTEAEREDVSAEAMEIASAPPIWDETSHAAEEEHRKAARHGAAEREAAEREAAEQEAAEARRREEAAVAEAERVAEAKALESQRRAELEMAEARRAAEQEAAEARRRAAEAEAEAARVRQEAEAANELRQREADEAVREAEAKALRRAEEQAADARRQAEEQAEEARQRAEQAIAEATRRSEEEAAEARRQAEAEVAEARRIAAEAEAEARRHAEAAEGERAARLMERQAEQRREEEFAAATQSKFSDIEARLEALSAISEENRIAPVREDLVALLRDIEELSRDRGDIAEVLEQIGGRLGEMEAKVNAARNLAGNRLGDIQDRISGLTERLNEVEIEIPGFDAVRENQGAILERFDRMEGLVLHPAAPKDLLEKIDALRRVMKTAASQEKVAEIEQGVLALAERIDALPEALSDAPALERLEEQLGTLAAELISARKQRISGAADLDERLTDLTEILKEVGETGRTPDLSGLEERLAEFGQRFDEDRRASGEAISRLEQRLAELSTAIEKTEDDAAVEALSGLTYKIDALADAIEAQDSTGARREVEALGGKLDILAEQLAEQAQEHLRPFIEQLQELFERVSTLGAADAPTPLSMRLEAIEERIAALGTHRGPDPRALQTQLEGIVSRLELLKGRSIDPARLTELFDRVDDAVRALPEERFDRLEQRLADAAASEGPRASISEEDLDHLAARLVESARTAFGEGVGEISEDRFARLESKLEQIGTAYSADGDLLSPDDLADLRGDIIALRRELRSLPGLGDGQTNLGDILGTIATRMDRLPEDLPATTAELEEQVKRISTLLDDPSHSRLALAHIEESLKTIEASLEETRRSLGYRAARDGDEAGGLEAHAVTDMARALSDDVTMLRDSTEASEKATREALDSVQDTLDAVVKRMAFLERDGEAGDRRPMDVVATPVELQVEPADEQPVDEQPTFDEPAESMPAPAMPAPSMSARAEAKTEPVLPAEAPEPVERFKALEPDEPEIVTAGQPEEPAAPRPGGLLSRFTSRQLLKRATGGRADSFTPVADDNDDGSDFPIEPGTDAPLSSALTGAPSSDTEFMSGARKGRASPVSASFGDDAIVGKVGIDPSIDEDFLSAARRAARAAAAEAVDSEGTTGQSQTFARITNTVQTHRGAVIAAAFAVAIAFAAFQIVRSQMGGRAPETAMTPQVEAPASPVASAPEPTLPEPTLAEPTVAETTPETVPGATPDQMQAEASQSAAPAATVDRAVDDVAASGAEAQAGAEPEISTIPPPAAAPGAPTPGDVASLGEMAAEPAAAPAAQQGQPPELPADFGSQRLRDAAMAGDPAAAFEVASRYAEGANGLQDMRSAVTWYERAAEAGLAPAQYRLGSIYEKGIGVPRDLVRAQSWYRRAVDAGNVKAMHNLAVLFAEGAGGEPDLEQAAELFRQAADHGVRDSQFNLAILHARGLGVKEDLIEAYKWFSIAATSGDEESAKRRDIIAAALSDADLAKAQAAAASFQPAPLTSEANEVLMPEGGWRDKQDSTSVEMQPDATGGKAGATAGALGEETGSTLSENDLVALVQKLLADNGYDPGPADGLFGEKTMQAIYKFQGKAGLPRNGQIDPGLVQALKEVSG